MAAPFEGYSFVIGFRKVDGQAVVLKPDGTIEPPSKYPVKEIKDFPTKVEDLRTYAIGVTRIIGSCYYTITIGTTVYYIPC